MKPKWRKIAAVVVVIVGLSSAVWLRPREPEYAGKPLSYWVDQIATTNLHDQAIVAIRAIGPKAVPILLTEVTQSESTWRKVYRAIWPRLPGSVQRHLAIPKTREMNRDETRDRICSALGILGPSAVPNLIAGFSSPSRDVRLAAIAALIPMGPQADAAVPGLIELVHDSDPEVRFAAVVALSYMGPKRVEAVPTLIDALHDDGIGVKRANPLRVRDVAAQSLGKIGPAAHSAAPQLTKMLDDSDALMRARSMIALWRIEQDTNLVKRAVAEIERAPDARACQLFLGVLGAIGPEAKAAIPVILKAMTNSADLPNPSQIDLPVAAHAALWRIDRKAAERIRAHTQ
jgi:HEAT repeat protein